MKKVFIALAAVAALAACTKSEVEYTPAGEIGFSPITENVTKSMLTDPAFPTGENFNVWAWYKQLPAGTTIADWQTSAATQQEYISDKPFTHRENSKWGGVTPYYWPKLGSLMFAGHYPSDIKTNNADATVVYTFNSSNNKMIFSNIRQTTVKTSGSSEDIMYFNMTPTSLSSNDVKVVFKHALSWITVNVRKTEDSPKIVINNIKFTEVNPLGEGTVDNQKLIEWETKGSKVNTDDFDTVFGTSVTLEEEYSTLPEHLFIPQTMAGELVIEYTVYSSETEHFSETYKKTLSGLKAELDTWAPSKHYTYNIEIGTTEILIAPTVTPWEEVTVAVPVQ